MKAKFDSWRLAVLFGLLAAWLLLLCGPALAHARLVETYPTDGGTLAESPEQVQLLFSEPIEAEFNPVEVYYEQGGDRVDEDDARVSPNNAKLLVADLGGLSEGSYTVEWRVASADAHPISGAYEFVVDTSAADANEDAGEPIELIERAAEQEEARSVWGTNQVAVLGLLLVGVLALAGLMVLRRGKGTL